MRYAVFVDWENLWYEHVGRCFPSYSSAWSFRERERLDTPLPDIPEVRDLTEEMKGRLSLLPSVIIECCNKYFGEAPQTIIASAVWEKVKPKINPSIDRVLQGASFITTTPTVDIHRLTIDDMKNVADYRLTMDVMRTLFIRKKADRSRNTIASLSQNLQLDSIVIASGDFIFGQLVDFVHNVVGVDVYLMAMSRNIAGPLNLKMQRPKFKKRLIYLDKLSVYQELRERCLNLDPLHAHKCKNQPTFETVLKMTTIKRLADRGKRDARRSIVPKADFVSWIRQWIAFWEAECGRACLNPEGALDLLWTEGIIRIDQSDNVVPANHPDNRTAVAFDRVRHFAFEHVYDVPPVYYLEKG